MSAKEGDNMKMTRIYTGEDGESHFEDMDISLGNSKNSERRSELIKTTGIIFRETGSDYDLDFHNAPPSVRNQPRRLRGDYYR
jgi:hypothetical protein